MRVQWIVGSVVGTLVVLGMASPARAQHYQPEDPRSPAAFTRVSEMGRDRDVRVIGLQPSVIVDNDSRIIVEFAEATMRENASAARCQDRLASLKETDDYKRLQERMRDQALDEDARASAREAIMALAREEMNECGGYEVSLRARVIPREGPAFDLPIPGYAVIASREEMEGDTLSQTVTTFLRHNFGSRLVSVRGDPRVEEVADVPDAIVDLPDDDTIHEGDHIELMVSNTFGDYSRTWVWDLEIRDVGFKTQEDASLLLIKRFDEPAGANQSNFKPTAGGSFMMTVKSRSRFLLALQPSFGFNASFVDFEPDKDLEIGLGLVFSLFGSTLQISYGWNLHAEEEREYWAIGIGFIELADRIAGNP